MINWDGSITRDFITISNVIQINTNGLILELPIHQHSVFNVVFGKTTLAAISVMLKKIN